MLAAPRVDFSPFQQENMKQVQPETRNSHVKIISYKNTTHSNILITNIITHSIHLGKKKYEQNVFESVTGMEAHSQSSGP